LQNNRPGVGTFFGTVFAVDPKLQTPRVDQYSVGLQREIPGDMVVEVRYVGSRSDNIARGVDLGQADLTTNGFMNDFLRAQNNYRVNDTERNRLINVCVAGGGTTAACTTTVNTSLPLSAGYNPALAGSVPLTVIPLINTLSGTNGGIGGAGTGQPAINATVLTHITNGTPADLVNFYITNTANLNNQPCQTIPPSSACNPAAVPRVRFLPNPSTGVIDLFLNDARYRYDSLQVEVRKRFSQGLYFQANYTYAKNLTDAIGTSQALFEPYLDNARKELDWQRADFDQTHTFNFNGIYELPFGKGKRWANYNGWADMIVGGWEISGLGQWTSGAPISFVDTRGTFNRTGRSARQTPRSSLTNDQIQALTGIFEANGRIYWIDPSILNSQGQASGGYNIYGTGSFANQVFFNANPGEAGQIGRTLIDGPNYFNLNMAVLKNIRFTESMRLQLRFEAFNVLNNVNFVQNTQLANINSATFGQITSAFGPREIQWAARFEF
jgi:hypothetical protein